eukprot:1357235-Ditylum_brightwellii.AAC.1
MKIDTKSLEFANRSFGKRPPPIFFYAPDSEKKLSPLDYKTYKLMTNPKDEKLAVYNMVVKYYEMEPLRNGSILLKLSCRGMLYKSSRMKKKAR